MTNHYIYSAERAKCRKLRTGISPPKLTSPTTLLRNNKVRPVRRTSSVDPTAMALLSLLTPVLALVLCLVIGYMLVKSRDAKSTSRLRRQEAEVDSRPWVDQDLQDNTEHAQREDGTKPGSKF